MQEYFCRRFHPISEPTQALPCRRFITAYAFFRGRPAKPVGLSDSSTPTQEAPRHSQGLDFKRIPTGRTGSKRRAPELSDRGDARRRLRPSPERTPLTSVAAKL